MKIAIVGAEEGRWYAKNVNTVKNTIERVLMKHAIEEDEITFISGGCPYGGIDIWAEKIADKLIESDLIQEKKIYLPQVKSWEDVRGKLGYKSRNLQIAYNCDILYVFSPFYDGKLIWNGGEWTANQAGYMGKDVNRVWINEKGDTVG